MIQEVLDSLVADGSIETVGLNSAGKMVYRANHCPDLRSCDSAADQPPPSVAAGVP